MSDSSSVLTVVSFCGSVNDLMVTFDAISCLPGFKENTVRKESSGLQIFLSTFNIFILLG